MNTISYETPSLRDLGDFEDLTMCLWTGRCRDFLGCGRAIICIG